MCIRTSNRLKLGKHPAGAFPTPFTLTGARCGPVNSAKSCLARIPRPEQQFGREVGRQSRAHVGFCAARLSQHAAFLRYGSINPIRIAAR